MHDLKRLRKTSKLLVVIDPLTEKLIMVVASTLCRKFSRYCKPFSWVLQDMRILLLVTAALNMNITTIEFMQQYM